MRRFVRTLTTTVPVLLAHAARKVESTAAAAVVITLLLSGCVGDSNGMCHETAPCTSASDSANGSSTSASGTTGAISSSGTTTGGDASDASTTSSTSSDGSDPTTTGTTDQGDTGEECADTDMAPPGACIDACGELLLAVYHRGAELTPGTELRLSCGFQGFYMLEFAITVSGFKVEGELFAADIVIDVDGYNVGPEGHFYTTDVFEGFGFPVEGCDFAGRFHHFVIPPDEIAPLTVLDGQLATVHVAVHVDAQTTLIHDGEYTLRAPAGELCGEPCDPLNSSCLEGQGCHQPLPLFDEPFACASLLGPGLGYGESCFSTQECADGPCEAGIPSCEVPEGTCCSEYCDLEGPNACPDQADGVECQPLFNPVAGFEHVGVCKLPP